MYLQHYHKDKPLKRFSNHFKTKGEIDSVFEIPFLSVWCAPCYKSSRITILWSLRPPKSGVIPEGIIHKEGISLWSQA